MNNLTKAIEEAMMDVSRWEYVHRDLIETPLFLSSIGLKDKVTGVVLELDREHILYKGINLNISKFAVINFRDRKNAYQKEIGLSDLYKAYGVEE